MKRRLLSVIVPAYKQGKTIRKDLANIDKVLREGLSGYDYEIICVVDGILDRTFSEARKLRRKKVKVVGYKKNRGKGYAVRYGMARSNGEFVSFLDAGRDIKPSGIMMLMAHMAWYNADVIVGSKRHPVSRVNYPITRHLLSIGYHLLVKILFGLPLTDTQSGIKVFKRRVIKKVLPRLLVRKFALDIEMLAVTRHLGFKRIYEAPIEVNFTRVTKTSITPFVVLRMLIDTLAIFYRLRILQYYNSHNRRNWHFDPRLGIKIERA